MKDGVAALSQRELDSDLGWGLGSVFRLYVRVVADAFADVAGGPRGYQVLRSAARDQPGSQLALAQQLGVDRTVMTYLIDDLVAAGFVVREPDPVDRRARRIVATERGLAKLAELDGHLAQVEDYILDELDVDEAAAFRALLMRLAIKADKAVPTANLCQVVNELGVEGDAC